MKKFFSILVGVGSSIAAGIASAAVPAAIGTGLTAVETDALAVIDLVWPLVISIVGALLLMKLFKRAASKV